MCAAVSGVRPNPVSNEAGTMPTTATRRGARPARAAAASASGTPIWWAETTCVQPGGTDPSASTTTSPGRPSRLTTASRISTASRSAISGSSERPRVPPSATSTPARSSCATQRAATTPSPSSRNSSLPTPRTSTGARSSARRSSAMADLVLDPASRHALPPADDRADLAAALLPVDEHSGVAVVHDETEREPHHEVVEEPYGRHRRDVEHPPGQRPRPAAALLDGLERDARDRLRDEHGEQHEIGQPGERVVADDGRRLPVDEQVVAQARHEEAPPLRLDRQELPPAGPAVAGEQQHEPGEQHRGEQEPGEQVHRPRELHRYRPGLRREHRRPDVEPGDGEHDDRRDEEPVQEPDARLPHRHRHDGVPGLDRLGRRRPAGRRDAEAVGCRAVVGNGHWTRTSTTSLPSASSTCAAQAMHGSNEWIVRRISSGRAGSASGVPTSATSYGPGCPSWSRGPAFHVDGTTAWYRARRLSEISTQWESPPLGASWNPTPRARFGQLSGFHLVVSATRRSPPAMLLRRRSRTTSECSASTSVSSPRARVRPSVDVSADVGTPSCATDRSTGLRKRWSPRAYPIRTRASGPTSTAIPS